MHPATMQVVAALAAGLGTLLASVVAVIRLRGRAPDDADERAFAARERLAALEATVDQLDVRISNLEQREQS